MVDFLRSLTKKPATASWCSGDVDVELSVDGDLAFKGAFAMRNGTAAASINVDNPISKGARVVLEFKERTRGAHSAQRILQMITSRAPRGARGHTCAWIVMG